MKTVIRMKTDDKFFSLKDFASLAGVTERTVRNWMKRGLVPQKCYTRPGGRNYLFNRAVSKAWLEGASTTDQG